MELYYLLVQRSLWTVQLIIAFLMSSEGRHSYRRNPEWKINAQSPPEILLEEQNVTVHCNDRIVLKCTVRNRRTKDVQWRLVKAKYPLTIGTETWTSDKDISVLHTKYNSTDEGWDLVIKRANPRHTNTYECQISTMQSHRRYVYLKVLDSPAEKVPDVTLTGTAYLDINQKVNLTCNATGVVRAPADVDWFHKGNIIDPHDEHWGNRITISKRIPQPGRWLLSELIIERSTLGDQGTYVCRSSENEANSFQVTILDTGDRRKDIYRDGVIQKQKRNNEEIGSIKPVKTHKNEQRNNAALTKENFALIIILVLMSKS